MIFLFIDENRECSWKKKSMPEILRLAMPPNKIGDSTRKCWIQTRCPTCACPLYVKYNVNNGPQDGYTFAGAISGKLIHHTSHTEPTLLMLIPHIPY